MVATDAYCQDDLFALPVNYDVGEYPHLVYSADFEGDGDKDLAVACRCEAHYAHRS